MRVKRITLLILISTVLISMGIKYIAIPLIGLSEEESIVCQPEMKKVWGLTIDTLKIDTLKIRPNQNISDILCNCGISWAVVDNLVKKSIGIFDVRKIKSGNNCYIISNKEDELPSFFIYEENPVDYYKFQLSDTLHVEKGQKDVETRRTSFYGVIKSSLWDTFVDQGVDPLLAVELSDIFAWTVDFFGIQKGDIFKVVFDEKFIEDKEIGIGMIHAATYISENDSISAYYFDNNGQKGYFDNKGNSLKKAFLKAPLNYSRISSHFSHSRFHPILKIHRPHHGIDYAAPSGTPVYSIGDGVVTKKSYESGGGGNYLNIKHNSSYMSQYMHLSKFAKGIETGTRVKQGQLIGYVGSTGLASGPHLDFRVFQNSVPINPLKVNAPPVEPVNSDNMKIFVSFRDSLRTELLSIQETYKQKDILASEQ